MNLTQVSPFSSNILYFLWVFMSGRYGKIVDSKFKARRGVGGWDWTGTDNYST